MNKDFKHLLDLAFLPDERCCVSDSQYSYHSVPISELSTGQITLVSPNESVINRAIDVNDLVFLAINPMKEGFRKDQTVDKYRNFLFEIDQGTIVSQLDYCNNLGLPTSCAVFSGNKSVHFLVSLDQDIDEKAYRYFYEWALNIGTLFDQSVKTPSKSIRIPGNTRPDTKKEQKLIYIRDKVKLDNFLEWLNKYENCKPKVREEQKKCLTNGANVGRLSGWVKHGLKNGFKPIHGRNRMWFGIFSDFCLNGFGEHEAVDILQHHFEPEHDFKESEWLTIAKSAYKKYS